jgi:hypothetical protein
VSNDGLDYGRLSSLPPWRRAVRAIAIPFLIVEALAFAAVVYYVLFQSPAMPSPP